MRIPPERKGFATEMSMIPAAVGQEQHHAAPMSSRDSMADDEFADDFEETLEELEEDEPDLDDDLDEPDLEDAEIDDDLVVVDDDLVEVVEDEEEDEEEAAPVVKKRRAADEEDDEEELIDPDDVEADLSAILKDRIAAGDDEQDEDEEETAEADTSADSGDRVQPRRSDEFVCQSCFLVKHISQRVGADDICRDCV
jgi:hypothetical protein